MEQQIIGVDIDGVLADFNAAYRQRLIDVTGRALIPEGEEPPTWYYATDHYGYTKEEDRATWKSIRTDRAFWAELEPYTATQKFLRDLDSRVWFGTNPPDVYFITTRPGDEVKHQTEYWLMQHGIDAPTVLIARGEKGPFAKGLGLTHFIDDKPENCFSVVEHSPNTRAFLLAARYNEWAHEEARTRGIRVIQGLGEFVEALDGRE